MSIRDWLGHLSDTDFRRVDEACGLLSEKATALESPATAFDPDD